MSSLRIGVDVRALAEPITGTGVVVRELLRCLVDLPEPFELFGYSTRPTTPEALPDGMRLRQGRGPTARWGSLWMQSGLTKVVVEDDLDVFWGPLQILPLRIPDLPMVVTMHDLVFRRFPETMSWRNRVLLPRLVPPSLKRANLVTAVSRTTGDAVVNELGVPRDKVRVVPNAVNESFSHVEPPCSSSSLLFVGTREPRKNLTTLLDALILLLESSRWEGELVLVGLGGWGQDDLSTKLRHPLLEPRVRFTGYVGEADLPALYRDARLFVMPSLYEGFGLPVLEAMASGVPVVCSDAEPFPEIAGGAALQVSSRDAGALAEAIERSWSDDALRDRMRSDGLRVAAGYSWQASARLLAASFLEAAGRNEP